MLRPGFAIDVTVRGLLAHGQLPASVPLVEFDAANATREDFDRICGGATAAGGMICLGALLPPGLDVASAAFSTLLPEALREDAVFIVTTQSLPQLDDWCWQRMTLLLGTALKAQTSSQLANAALRAHSEELEHSLALAEVAFADFRKEPLRLGLQLEPGFVYAEPPPHEPGTPFHLTVDQNVPTALGNVVYLDLFFSRAGTGVAGQGRLVAKTAYAGALLCDHTFKLTDVVQGWNRFVCVPEATRHKQPFHLKLSLQAPQAVEVKPGLAAPLPDPANCARVEGGGLPARPLAIRAWCGIAGLRYTRQAGTIGAVAQSENGTMEVLSLPGDLIASAEPYQVANAPADFSPISYEAETQSLLVHPLGRAPTVARLARVHVERLTSLAALAQLRHFDAQPTDFALFAQPVGAVARFDASTPLDWLHLQAGEWGDVRCALPEPLNGDVDIFLLTRNQTDDFNLSWAFFRGLQLTCANQRQP